MPGCEGVEDRVANLAGVDQARKAGSIFKFDQRGCHQSGCQQPNRASWPMNGSGRSPRHSAAWNIVGVGVPSTGRRPTADLGAPHKRRETGWPGLGRRWLNNTHPKDLKEYLALAALIADWDIVVDRLEDDDHLPGLLVDAAIVVAGSRLNAGDTGGMRTVLILGAGFGGLELAACLSESFVDEVRIVLVDKNDSFTFGFSKLEILFNGQSPDAVRLPYADLARAGVEFRQERVTWIEPRTRRVVTDRSEYEPDFLVVALGADYDPGATPGFVEDGHEYYSIQGACQLRDRLDGFTGGTVLLAILSVPFKCPPAPFEGAMLLHATLARRGIRDRTRIHVISPMESPIPVSAETSSALVNALAQRGIAYSPGRRVRALDPTAHIATTRTGDLKYDLFIGIPPTGSQQSWRHLVSPVAEPTAGWPSTRARSRHPTQASTPSVTARTHPCRAQVSSPRTPPAQSPPASPHSCTDRPHPRSTSARAPATSSSGTGWLARWTPTSSRDRHPSRPSTAPRPSSPGRKHSSPPPDAADGSPADHPAPGSTRCRIGRIYRRRGT